MCNSAAIGRCWGIALLLLRINKKHGNHHMSRSRRKIYLFGFMNQCFFMLCGLVIQYFTVFCDVQYLIMDMRLLFTCDIYIDFGVFFFR